MDFNEALIYNSHEIVCRKGTDLVYLPGEMQRSMFQPEDFLSSDWITREDMVDERYKCDFTSSLGVDLRFLVRGMPYTQRVNLSTAIMSDPEALGRFIINSYNDAHLTALSNLKVGRLNE